MDILFSLLALGSLILVWLTVSKKMSSKAGLIRHLAGAGSGLLAMFLVVSIGLGLGLIEAEPDPKSQALISSNTAEQGLSKPNFKQMMEDRNDYSIENGELQIISESPLIVKLGAADMQDQAIKIKWENVRKTALYGVFRTFVHTDEPSIEITAFALDLTGLNPREQTENLDIKITLNLTRENALQAIKTVLPDVKDFSDIVTTKKVGSLTVKDEWTDEFAEYYWKSEKQIILINELLKY